jgi:hypothetical protein
VGYYPDMSSQAAAQGYFEDLIARALESSPILRRVPGAPALYIDAGTAVGVPAGGSVAITPTLGNRGVLLVQATWNFATGPLANAARVTLSGSAFTIFNDNGSAANCFWTAYAA